MDNGQFLFLVKRLGGSGQDLKSVGKLLGHDGTGIRLQFRRKLIGKDGSN